LLMQERRLDFPTALGGGKAGTCFTTHTPVPAGNDAFPPHLIEHYLTALAHDMRIDRAALMALGRQRPTDESELFGMTVLAIKTANTSNGVSQLHGSVSRKMWQGIWPELPASEVPIFAITNGVHTQSWLAADVSQLYDRYLGVQWEERPADYAIW